MMIYTLLGSVIFFVSNLGSFYVAQAVRNETVCLNGCGLFTTKTYSRSILMKHGLAL